MQHWADGGTTGLYNLVLLRKRHHWLVYEEGFRISLDSSGEVKLVRPDGRPFPAATPSPFWTGAPLASVTERLDQDGVTIDSQTVTPAWRSERLDVGWAVGRLWRSRSDGPVTPAAREW